MKISNMPNADTVVNQNNREQVQNDGSVKQEKQGQIKNGSLKASELNLCQDPIEEKKKKAKEEAMDFIKKQFASDSMVDDIKGECRNDIKQSKSSAEEASRELVAIRKEKEEFKEMYQGDEDNEDYKAQLKMLGEQEGEWKKQYDEAHLVIGAATAGIKAIKQEELKHHSMIDATKNAEKSLKASSDEIIGMLKDEAVDKIDEDLEEVVEEAKDKKEENLKEEAEREAARAEREKQAQEVEDKLKETKKNASQKANLLQDHTGSEEILRQQQEIERNTQKILEEQKLLGEEIKGIVVDSQL
ncbi:MAG: hypothetical protein HFI70_10365 [Lachnospiraceae bacterium]|nr:hypothetical protein [Lachnospiraceae bacterium]